jgi:serine/threonine protein kinase
MSPEQCAKSKSVDFSTDLFSRGCVLYHASTGVLPFPGKFPVDVMIAVRTIEPKPIKEVEPALPVPFCNLVMTLLSKTPAGRRTSALAVRDVLRQMRALLQPSP